MPSLLFVDANVPIYAAGRPHPLKEPSAEIVRLIAQAPDSFVTDAEVLQELLHYYRSRGNWVGGEQVLRAFAALMADRLEEVSAGDVIAAADLANMHPLLSARDLLHLAVMKRLGAEHIVTADQDFGGIVGITRLDPADVAVWRGQTPLPASSEESQGAETE